ncbi:MAG: hypothetical protein ABJA62_12760 [Luteimonas sp.]
MKRIICGVLLWACMYGATARVSDAVRKQFELSMLVTGTIDIQPDGSVASYALDHPEVLPSAVPQLVERVVHDWRFEPVFVGGKAVRARSKMSLRIVAKEQENTDYKITVGSVNFGGGGDPKESVSSKTMRPPRYPEAALQDGMAGTVYLLLRIGQQGTVEEAASEQVNLTTYGNEREMRTAREILTRSALQASKFWKFHPPTSGNAVDQPFWCVRVPVTFSISTREAKYGEWEAYIPGLLVHPDWAPLQRKSSDRPDAMVAGALYPIGSGPQLLTPLEG